MGLGKVLEYFVNNAEKIKSLAVYLPIVWAMLFSKDWVSISCFYKFYEINRTNKAEIKQLLNFRYIVSLFLSILCFGIYCIIIRYAEVFVFFPFCIIPIISSIHFFISVGKTQILKRSEDKGAAEKYRRALKNGLLSFRIIYLSSIIWILFVIGTIAAQGYSSWFLSWLIEADWFLTTFSLASFLFICVLIDNVLTVVSTSINQPSYFNYLAKAEFIRISRKQKKSIGLSKPVYPTYFYRFNESVTIAKANGSTYIVVFPFENETRTVIVGIRALICRKKNNMVHVYLLPAEIKYDIHLSELDVSHMFVDRITRLGLDVRAPGNCRHTNELANKLVSTLKIDNICDYWDGDYWQMVENSHKKSWARPYLLDQQ